MDAKSAVLVIDDDPVLLRMAGEILRQDYQVSNVKSGKDAIELMAGGYMPDIILLDIDMPFMDGFETLRRLRELEDAQDIPVIFLTGLDKAASELRGLSSGAVDYITKPFVKEILLARIKNHLENGRRLRMFSIMEKEKQGRRIDESRFEAASAVLGGTEKKVARLITLGYSNQEIGETLFYSYNYVKKVVATIYDKLNVTKRDEVKKMFLIN